MIVMKIRALKKGEIKKVRGIDRSKQAGLQALIIDRKGKNLKNFARSTV